MLLKLIHLWMMTVLLVSSTSSIAASEPTSGTGGVWVSLVRLIANPARYEGTVVEVTGYLDEGGTLFLTKDHAEALDSASGIRFADTTEGGYITQTCTRSYGSIVGSFRIRRGEPAVKDDPTYYALYDLERVVTVKNGVTTICWQRATSEK